MRLVAIERIDAALGRAVDEKRVPGVVALAANEGAVLYEGAFGQRDIARGPAMTLDTIFRIASMTKPVTSTAAMQLVEAGKIGLDDPVGEILPALAAPQVLEGFDASGTPRLRPAKRPITLRRLLTHTSGFGYEWANPLLLRYARQTDTPPASSGKLAGLGMPLACDPGERWAYSISTDWVGRLVEAVSGKTLDVYMRDHILAPLGMDDTGFVLSAAQSARLVGAHQRQADGTLTPLAIAAPAEREFFNGGGGLYSTGRDYITFLQMQLNGGRLGGAQILRPETVAMMAQNQIGELDAGIIKSTMPERANDCDLFPGIPCKFGFGFLINTQSGANGRSAGSLAWGGIYNSYFWLDPVKRVAGVILAQLLPWCDPSVLSLLGELERGVYAPDG